MVTPMKMMSVYKGDERTFDINAVGYRTGVETLLVRRDFRRRPAGTGAPDAACSGADRPR